MLVDWEDVKEDYAKLNSEIDSLKLELESQKLLYSQYYEKYSSLTTSLAMLSSCNQSIDPRFARNGKPRDDYKMSLSIERN